MNLFKTILLSSLTVLGSLSVKAQEFKEPVGFKLKNGMNIIISENKNSPKAYASFTLDASAFKNEKDGIVELLNAVLNEGINKKSPISFKDNSGKLNTSSADFDQDLSQFAALIQSSTINEQTFNTGKAKLLMSLKAQDYDYDQRVNENSIGALTIDDVKSFYKSITPAKTYLTIAGNIETSTAKSAAKKAFGSWTVTESESSVLAHSK
jgi:predicted Zn-dependent peptidase